MYFYMLLFNFVSCLFDNLQLNFDPYQLNKFFWNVANFQVLSGSYLNMRRGCWAKSFFYIFDWNRISKELILFKCCTIVHCQWQCNIHVISSIHVSAMLIRSGACSMEKNSVAFFGLNQIWTDFVQIFHWRWLLMIMHI